jgi:hypothetical protein
MSIAAGSSSRQKPARSAARSPPSRPTSSSVPELESVFDLQLHLFFYRLICRELVDWLLIYSIPEPLPSIGC